MNDPMGRPTGRPSDPRVAEIAALGERVDRLERQLAQMVKTFSKRLSEHGRRLDGLDQPTERRPGHQGG